MIFDPQFSARPVSIDLRNPSFEEALQAVSTATRNFYRVTAQRTVTVIPDTAAKRQEYEEEIVRPFFLSNADLKETMDLLRDRDRCATRGAGDGDQRDHDQGHAGARGGRRQDHRGHRQGASRGRDRRRAARGRSHALARSTGCRSHRRVDPPTGINGAARHQPRRFTLRDLSNLTQADILLTNLPALYYRLLKQDSNTRTLANPQLRTSEGMPAQARFGERVPVPVTIFSPIATGGVNQQPITSFNYENIGVNIDITPRTHHDDEVSLALKIEVSSISGAGFGGLPTFGNREISTVIRLKTARQTCWQG